MTFPDITAARVADQLPAEALGRAVTVYGASSADIDDIYKSAARELGYLVARSDRPLVSGGGREGLMGAAIEGASSAGGVTIGVLPDFMITKGWQHTALTQMVAVNTMHRRKAMMAALASDVVAMPGGIGTFEELLEIITWRQLGLYCGNVIILNTAGYYNPLLDMLARAGEQHFMRPCDLSDPLFRVVATPAEAIALITTH